MGHHRKWASLCPPTIGRRSRVLPPPRPWPTRVSTLSPAGVVWLPQAIRFLSCVQCVAVCCSVSLAVLTATHCNTLQHTVTHCKGSLLRALSRSVAPSSLYVHFSRPCLLLNVPPPPPRGTWSHQSSWLLPTPPPPKHTQTLKSCFSTLGWRRFGKYISATWSENKYSCVNNFCVHVCGLPCAWCVCVLWGGGLKTGGSNVVWRVCIKRPGK